MKIALARHRLAGSKVWATPQFNLICNMAALGFLTLSGIHSFYGKPATYDFGQYYMGGLLARTGEWSSLYPIPRPGSPDHPGYPSASTLPAKYEQLVHEAGVDDDTRFVLPPPVALVCAPLSLFGYKTANAIWVLLMSLCVWLVALQAAHIYRELYRRPSRIPGLLVLVIAGSPLCRHTVRTGNITPLVGLCVGAATIGLLGKRPIRSSLGLVLGALGKFVTIVFVPLYVLSRNWRVLILSSVLLLAVNLTTIAVGGIEPYVTFGTRIVPTLNRPSARPYNVSAQGFLTQYYGRGQIPAFATAVVRAAELVLFLLGATGLLRNFDTLPGDPDKLLAAALAMVGGFLLISPQSWSHYLVYLLPFWGYLIWDFQRSPLTRWAVVIVLPFFWLPPSAIRSIDRFQDISMPVVVESYPFWGLILLTTMATLRLHGPSRPIDEQGALAPRDEATAVPNAV
jgi:hypothetical protein